MKRVGYITDKDGRRITLLEAMGDYGNVQKAYNKARKCKRHRKDVLIFTKDKEENLDKVREDIINLAYEPSKYHYFKVYEPKERQIMALPFYDRVVQHAINNVLEPIFDKRFISQSYACRKGKGMHAASDTLKEWLYEWNKYHPDQPLYAINGEVWQCVEDANIAWHCGASRYKHAECRNANSIGIEMCVRKKNTKSMGATDKDWYFEDATVEAAAELTRYLMNKYGVPASHVIRHYDVTGKICPNPYVYNTSAHTWDEFKRKISGQAETPQGGNEKTIWNFLTGKGLNAYAVAGIMGNLYAESGLMPNNLQNTYNNKLGKTDAEYTAAVDNGSYGNFVKDSAGYGLAQWTYWSRKQALLNHAKQAGVSIADLNMQLGFLWEELQGYTAVMDALKKAGSVCAASDAVLTGYEKPADQSETVKKKRAEYGEGYYKKYAAGNGTKYYRVRKSWTDAASQLGAFTSLENAKSACKAGYTVYDDNGKAVYTAVGQQTSAGVPFSVQVDILDLNIRTGAGTNYAKTGETTGKGVFTIVEVKAGQGASAGWGRLKSGAGWISLDYATRLA